MIMGRKGSWFSAVKKVLSPESKKDQKNQKSKKKWFGKHKDSDQVLSNKEAQFPVAPLFPPIEHISLANADDKQNKHAYSVALATAAAAKAAVAAAQAAAEVVRLTGIPLVPGNSKEEIAAIKIQTAFRGYLARRALHALRGLVRLKTLIKGQSVKRQADTTLRCMQTLARMQSQIRERRIRKSEENQALQWQWQQKREKELEKLQASLVEEEWNDTLQSKEQIEERLANRQEAAIRRERALAYAYSHQQTRKNSLKSVNPTFMDPNYPHWGWSWLERWMAGRPWEGQNDHESLKSAATNTLSVGEITKLYALRDLNHDNKPSPASQKSSRPSNRQSPSTLASHDDDYRSLHSVQSERYSRRYSIAGSSVRDDESLASSPAVPSYMAPTKATMVRSKTQSPLGVDKRATREKASVSSARRRLSFPASPAASRRPAPAKNVSNLSQNKGTKGGSR